VPEGKFVSVQVSLDGRRWVSVPPPPDVPRFAWFYFWPYVDIVTERPIRVRCRPLFYPPVGEATAIEPLEGVLASGSYFFPFSLQLIGDAPLGIWRAKLFLEYAADGWETLATWEEEVFNLIAVGDPSAEITGVEFSPDTQNWFTTPLLVQPGNPYAFRVHFNAFLPLRTMIGVYLALLDPYGKVISEDFPQKEFPPGAVSGMATLNIHAMPEQPGDYLGRAIIRAKHKDIWLDLAAWDGVIGRVAPVPAPAPVLPGWEVLIPIAGLGLIAGLLVRR